MLEALVRFSVRRRGTVLAVWFAIAVLAALSLRKLSVDAVPDVTNTQVGILTSAPGLSPLEVEQYLTYPVETAMNGLPGVVEIRSTSRAAVSAVTVVFDDDTDVWFARQLVSERLKLAEAEIPQGYGRPELAPVSTGLGEIYEFYLTSEKHTAMELRTLLDWVVAYKLRSVPGVIEVNGMGGEAKQYQVVLDPKRLAAHHLSFRQVHEALVRNNASLGGGYIEKNSEAYVIRGDAQMRTPEDIATTVVAADVDGTPVLLRQIADVKVGPALRFGVVTKHGHGEIAAGTVMMLVGANSRTVVHDVKARLDAIQKELPEGVQIRSYYDRAEFIERMLKTVFVNLAEGAALVVVVLFLTLGSIRGALIAALAIPLSMGIAIIGMVRFKVTGNLMSLGAIDFGLLVDGAIVMLEVTLARLASTRPPLREDVAAEVSRAMQQAARPVTFSLLIILLVYLPLMGLEGVEGRMFRPMAITVALALGGALLFSLSAFPALAAFTLSSPRRVHDDSHGVFGRIRGFYGRVLAAVLRHPVRTLGAAIAALGAVGGVAMSLGAEFVPRLDEGELSLDVKRLPSVSITEAQRLGVQVEDVLARFPEVKSIVTRTGRAEVATDPVGPDETEVMVKLAPKETWTSAHDLDDLGEKIKAAVEAEVPATFVAVSQPIEDRVNQLLSGSRADVVVKVFGEDLTVLKRTADEIGAVIRDVPGRGDLRVQRVLGLPLLEVRPDRGRLARYGIPAEDVLEVVEASRVGKDAGRIFEGPRRFDLKLLLPPASLTPEAFGELPVGAPDGRLIPMASIATIRETEGPAVINRESLERRVLVEANVRGRDLVSFVGEAQARVARVTLPPGIHLEWGGQFENFERASSRLAVVVPIALTVIFSMLFLMFGDMRYASAVFAGAPFALIGGIIVLWARGLPFSIPAAVGFIAVAGVAVLNGVVMASEVRRRLMLGETESQAVQNGALTVLRAVLTTALVAAIGFFPMAISTRAGAEVQRPLATVVIGGIVSSTLLSLTVLPVLLRYLVRRPISEEEAAAAAAAERSAALRRATSS
ncbi:MAG TPA: CusA/CzcA family heavy metal efflux RND transporter [Polyangiaceae bacterium]|nr:CusA/CzcA family heavy metal efflux RND transporter [Polyangiaceae bacterium]